MTAPVWNGRGVPVIRILTAAERWVINQIIRWHDGGYLISDADGGLYESVYGVHRPASVLLTDPVSDSATMTAVCRVGRADGTRADYTVTITISGIAQDEGERS